MQIDSTAHTFSQPGKKQLGLEGLFFLLLRNQLIGFSFLVLIGPAFAFITSILVVYKVLPLQHFFLCICFFCTLASFKWEQKATLCATICYLLVSVLFFNHLNAAERLWSLGALCSLVLAHFLTVLGNQELSSILQLLQMQSADSAKNSARLEEQIQETESHWKKEWDLLVQELEKWKEQAEQRLIEKKSVEQLLQLSRGEIASLMNVKNQLIVDITEARKTAFDTLKANEELQQKLLVLPALPEELFAPVEQVKVSTESPADSRIESLYKQLRGQFEEKTRVLAETRTQLFRSEGALLQLEKQQDQQEMESAWEQHKVFCCIIQEIQSEKKELETEISELEALFTQLIDAEKSDPQVFEEY